MLTKSTFITLVALFLLGSFTYAIKQKVIDLDNELSGVHRRIAYYQESMHILTAEWAYLTRPSRLQSLVEQHTHLYPSQGIALVSYEDVFKTQESNELYGNEVSSMRLASSKGR